MKISVEQWNAAIRAVLVKAASDPGFRAKCLEDASTAICLVSGLTAPATLRFSEFADGKSIVLPPIVRESGEITDSELLDSVAGGGVNTLPSIGDLNGNCAI